MSSPLVNGASYDVYFSDSNDSINELGVVYEDTVGSLTIFVKKAGVKDNGDIEDERRIFVNIGHVFKIVEKR